MATADEILATMAEEAAATDQMAEVCTIDRCTRAVTIPEALRIVGVETDKDVTRRHFKVLCSYRGTNLSTFRIRIHFMNANKEKDIYYVTDAAQDGEYLTFSWVISRNATKYKGKLQFIACMVCDGGTDEEREWNSTLGEFTVLEGLEVELTDGEEEQARDAITQLLAVIDARESEAVEAVAAQGTAQVETVKAAGAAQEASIAAKGAATLETIPDDYATLHNNVATLTQEVEKVSANTRNLWPFGESVEVSKNWASLIVSPLGEYVLPAGTYTVSAIVSSTGTNSSKSCIAFCKDEAGNPLASVNLDRNAREYGTFTLPEDANLIVIYAETTCSNSAGDTAVWKNIQIESGTLMTDYIPSVSAKDIALHEEVKKSSAVNKAIKSSVSEMNGTSGYAAIGMIPNVKKNERLVLRGKVSSIGTLAFGTYYGSISDGKKDYFKITDTEIIAYQYSGASVAYPHGLTITNNITLLVEGNSTTGADVTLISNGEIFKQSDVRWDRRYACGLFARGGIGSKLTDVDIEWTCTDLTKDIWMFGDSYFSYTDRWYKYMFQYGYTDNLLMAAFPGATSTHMMVSLKTLLTIARPKAVVWCLGMNDGSDAGAPAPDWMSNVKELETLCTNLDIELILATTPTVTTISHEYKNAYVRASGYRYIEFAGAVGASAEGVWYADMLSSDGVHPTDKGARALFGAVIADLPEAMVTN